MGTIRDLGRAAWRLFVIDGSPSSGEQDPAKADIQAFVDAVDDAIENIPAIVDAAVTNVVIDNNVVYTDTTAGLAATTDGDLFLVQGSGDAFATLYLNDTGVAVSQGLQQPSKGYIDTILNNLESQQTVGRPTDATLTTGTTQTSNVFFAMEPAARDGYLRRVRYYGKATGTGYIRVASVSGTTLTIVRNVPFTVAAGVNEAIVDIPVAAGQIVGVYGVSLFAYTVQTPDGLGYWRLDGNNTTSGTGTQITSATRLQIGFDIAFQEVTKADVTTAMSAIRAGVEKVQIVGRPIGTPLISLAGISNNTIVMGNVARHDGWIDQIDYYGLLAGKTWFWGIFDISGNTKTTTLWRPIVSQLGEQSVTFDPVPILAGQAVGYYAYDSAGSAGIIANGAARTADDGFGAWNASGRLTSLTDSSLSRTFSSEIRFHLKYIEPVVPLAPLPLYVVFLIIGQSNAVGRGESRGAAPEGALMWKVATQSLEPMEDPTGNDDTAGGSAWPRFATVFRDRTGYNCAVANLAEGGTYIVDTDWATTLRATTQAEWEAMLAAMDGAGYAWRVGGIICNVGEYDANAIDDGSMTITKATYKAAYIDLIEWARGLQGMADKTPFIIVETGTRLTGDTTGYQQVREAQREVVAEVEHTYMGWNGAKNLVARLLMLGDGPYHYKLPAYDEMGQSCAVVASAVCVGGA